MAQWRPLHRNVTTSDKMLALANEGAEFAQWLWTALLPYTDRAGRLNGNPLALLGTIFEGYPYTPEKLEAGLHTLARVGLVVIYRTSRHQLLVEYTNFEELNIFDKREAQSKLPGPTDDGSELITPSPASPAPAPDAPPEHPKETTGDSQGTPQATPYASQPLHVHVHKQLHLQSTDTTSPEKQSEPPSEELVEAKPRRESNPPAKKRKPKRSIRAVDRPFFDAWNENRGQLPSIIGVGKERENHLDRLRREFGDDALEIFTDAVRQVAQEPYYVEKGYGIGHLLSGGSNKVLKWAEKWRDSGGMSDGNRRLASTAYTVANALGGLDDQPN